MCRGVRMNFFSESPKMLYFSKRYCEKATKISHLTFTGKKIWEVQTLATQSPPLYSNCFELSLETTYLDLYFLNLLIVPSNIKTNFCGLFRKSERHSHLKVKSMKFGSPIFLSWASLLWHPCYLKWLFLSFLNCVTCPNAFLKIK